MWKLIRTPDKNTLQMLQDDAARINYLEKEVETIKKELDDKKELLELKKKVHDQIVEEKDSEIHNLKMKVDKLEWTIHRYELGMVSYG
jgi:DNA repair ATPase RecN